MTGILELSDQEFLKVMINMLRASIDKEDYVQIPMGNGSRETETLK